MLGRQDRPIVVLKFGSSVLDGPEGIEDAATEIERWVGRGSAVVAVASALAGVTDNLTCLIGHFGAAVPESEVARLLATGEEVAATLLGVAATVAGLRCSVGRVETMGLRTKGPLLDADPVCIDEAWFRKAFGRFDVLVVPGFVGRRVDGALSLLGRGGSDLTALFLGLRLAAQECRLVKDIDGLYTLDPNEAAHDVPPQRYELATWAEALEVGGDLVQPKAVRFAQSVGLSFTIAALGGQGTLVGPGPCLVADPIFSCAEHANQ